MKREDFSLDPWDQDALCRRVAELAASYTPEWRFDKADPDIGSTIALIFTNQMADNIRRLNQLPEKYHTAFVNLLGLSLLPAYPSSGVVMSELVRETVPGVELPRGTKLMAVGGNGDPILFETMGDIYLTNARITDVLSLSGVRGRILPILGELKPVELVPSQSEVQPEPIVAGDTPFTAIPPFRLFDFDEPCIEKNALLLYHRNVFNTEAGVALALLPVAPDGSSLAAPLSDGTRYRWSFYTKDGLAPFSSVSEREGILYLDRSGESEPVTLDGTSYHLLCLEALEPVSAPVLVQDLRVASSCQDAAPDFILHSGEELSATEFLPFGESVSIFDECYIGDDRVFSQQDATITLSFHLSAREKLLSLSAQQEADELKIIKRKPRVVLYENAAACPQRVSVEYFNGTGWRKLLCNQSFSTLLDGTHSGDFSISFPCPEDWRPLPVGGFEGRSMRLRVTQADNCYLLPCKHTMPVFSHLSLSYSYSGKWKQPQRIRTVCGARMEDVTQNLLQGSSTTIFQPLPYPAAALYLGLDRRPEGAPVSILFDVEENVHFTMAPVSFEYSTRTDFRPLKVIDGTKNFSCAGTVLFMPPSDFAPMEVEGKKRWWLRLRGEDAALRGYHAPIRSTMLNAAEIRNQETLGEEGFYVDAAAPGMVFPLAARNILSAEVFVSELGQYSRRQMEQLSVQTPEDIRISYDFTGDVTAFFLRWTEVENFDLSKPGDRHYLLDRMNNAIVFGDGVHVRIPQAQRDVSFTVRCICCDGQRGNVPAGAVNSFFGNVMYVESVRNPIATYAGSNLESLDNARRRGANLLSSRGRFISELDFVRAVQSFSSSVEKVKCMAGRDIDGRSDPALITIAIMTRDYRDGAYSFNNIKEPLCRRLLSRCDATVTPDCLLLSEPVYVEISVDVWTKVDEASRSFDVQNLILDSIRGFLDPLSGPGHNGWDIGTLPSESQLKMLLQSLSFGGHVSRIIASARYVDQDGVHEAGLENLPANPFAIGINGQHRVYIEFQ